MTQTQDTADTRIAFSPQEVAEMLGVSVSTMYRIIRQGDIKVRRVGARNYRILAADIDAYLDGQR